MSRDQLTTAIRSLSVLGPVSRALSPLPNARQTRHRAPLDGDLISFNIFRESTAPGTSIFAASDFWSRQILQLAHTESAMWHAVVAMGAIHRHMEQQIPGLTTSGQSPLVTQGMSHYAKAMELTRCITSPSVTLALSLALSAVANLLHYFGDVTQHLLGGVKILGSLDRRGKETPHLAGALTRMNASALTFHESDAPLPFTEASMSQTFLSDASLHGGYQLISYDMATSALFDILLRVELSGKIDHSPVVIPRERNTTVLRDLRRWEIAMARLEGEQTTDTRESRIAQLYLRFYHVFTILIGETGIAGEETRWDVHLGLFERMERVGAALARLLHEKGVSRLSLEQGIVSTLFFIVLRCRHPALRRRALAILRNYKRQEGMWRSDGAARVGEVIINVEESGIDAARRSVPADEFSMLLDKFLVIPTDADIDALLAVPWQVWSTPGYQLPSEHRWEDVRAIPESARVKVVRVQADTDAGMLHLRLEMIRNGAESGVSTVGDPVVSLKL